MIGRLLGIDHGLKRIGVAVSDALGITARELTIIDVNNDDAATFAALKQLATEQGAVAIIVGLPSNVGGSTEQADAVRTWVEGLRGIVALPVLLWDEQLSSADAKELAKRQRRPKAAPIDDLAARIILQSYLNALADGLAPHPTNSTGY